MATSLQRAYENVRAGEAIVRDANRFRQIVGVLIRHGFGALIEKLELDDRTVHCGCAAAKCVSGFAEKLLSSGPSLGERPLCGVCRSMQPRAVGTMRSRACSHFPLVFPAHLCTRAPLARLMLDVLGRRC